MIFFILISFINEETVKWIDFDACLSKNSMELWRLMIGRRGLFLRGMLNFSFGEFIGSDMHILLSRKKEKKESDMSHASCIFNNVGVLRFMSIASIMLACRSSSILL